MQGIIGLIGLISLHFNCFRLKSFWAIKIIFSIAHLKFKSPKYCLLALFIQFMLEMHWYTLYFGCLCVFFE